MSVMRRAGCAWLALCMPLAACAGSGKETSSGKASPNAPTVAVLRLHAEAVGRTVTLPGEIKPFQSVDLYPKVDGFVKAVAVDKGSRVKPGQVLARLEAPEVNDRVRQAAAQVDAARGQVDEAEAQFQARQATYDRLRAAAKVPGVIAPQELTDAAKAAEAARARVRSVSSAVGAARANQRALASSGDYLTVTAPFAGIVTERNVHPGALVGPAGAGAKQALFRLEDDSRLRLTVSVPEAALDGVQTGLSVPFTVPAYPDRSFKGVVRLVPHSLDAKTRTEPIELEVQNAGGELYPGMYAELSWPIRRSKPTFFVPASAVVTTTARTFVVEVKDGRAAWVDVRKGASLGDRVEVFGALAEGDSIAVRGSDELKDQGAVATTAAPSP